MTRWIRTAGIVAGSVVGAGMLATAALAGNGVSTPADQAVSSATEKACGNLAPALGEAKAAPAPALPVCAGAGGVKAPDFSWEGPGAIGPRAGVPSGLPSDLPSDVPGPETMAQDPPDFPKLPFEPDLGPKPSLPQLPSPSDLGGAQPELPAPGLPQPDLGARPELPGVSGSQLPTKPDVPSGRDLPAQPKLPDVPAAPAPLG